jgi:hypothetical protein
MAQLQPIYTPENCSFSGPLRWGLTVFWRTSIADASWLADLADAVKTDGLRVLGHRFSEPGVSQFALSTLCETAPLFLISRIKGRLQYLLRRSLPKAFQRNYALRSFGPANRAAVEGYIAGQLKHHPMADARVQAALKKVQINCPEVDLSRPRSTAHGIYWYNLHIVLVHQHRWTEIREHVLQQAKSMIERSCQSKGYWLTRAGILADHVHLAVSCPIETAPRDVALGFLNNLAFVHGMTDVFQYGAFTGTFGEYHQGAVVNDRLPGFLTNERGGAGNEPTLHPGERGGGEGGRVGTLVTSLRSTPTSGEGAT